MNRIHYPHWGRARALLLLLPVLIAAAWLLRVAMAASLPPDQGPGGPILVVTSSSSTYGKYYAEILRTEGLNDFAVADISAVTPTALAAYDVVVLSKMTLSSDQVTTLTNWVNGGGNLVAMGPDPQLANLLGLTPVATSMSDGYLLVDSSTQAGNGIVNQTIQFHGSADRYTLNGASSIATLYSNATSPTANPAVTLRSVGAGQAAAFTYDLATSIVFTRQGNPAWAAQERDGFTPIRSDDKFYGDAAGDPQRDWVDLTKSAIPQADEQQRLLANLILTMNLSKKPLPRFWYFPNGKKAVVIMTGDDHGNGGTAGRFDQFLAASPSGCSVDNWECVRSTSYIYSSTPLTNTQAATYNSQGFEVGLHINTNCTDFTPASLEATYVQQIGDWVANYTNVPPPITQRHHCIVWSDWVTGAKTELNHGMRLDVSYYFWPPNWVNDTPGLFTGSAMPMRVADLDGTLIDVYEATTQMTDESGQTYPFTIDTLLDRAIGPEGYFGAYTVNAHTDTAASPVANAVLSSALARGVPIVSSRQMLTWLDARNNSSFGSLTWNGSSLNFTIAQDAAAVGLSAMLPNHTAAGAITAITRNGSPVAFAVQTIKGIQYATFPGIAGAYAATYAADTTSPTVTTTSPVNGATGVSVTAKVMATFSEAIDPATINTTTFELRDSTSALVAATVAYDAATLTATLTPSTALVATAGYSATVKGGATDPRVKDLSGNALAANAGWAFTTGAGPSCPCSAWSSTVTPATPSVNDPGAVELGVKFTSDFNGSITGIRFYKGTGNTGTHIGNLWTITGQLLATATFGVETATGWQQVSFATPVAITADTVYVASYFAPNGNYAGDNLFFANAGIDNSPVHLLRDGVNGGNGVYNYSSVSTFPNSTFQATNYWVDVVFTTGSGGGDTTPPTVTATSPGSGEGGVSPTANVTATFSEAMDATTITPSTFQLQDPSNAVVPASVTYNAATLTATLTPSSPLAASTIYSVTVKGGATDPRAKDIAGNALIGNTAWTFTTASGTGICASPPNPIVAENCLTGNGPSEWDISGAGDPSIQGFATNISVNRGSTVTFKVDTNATNYRFDIYRMGYYGGNGARRVAQVTPTATLPQNQPNCLTQPSSGLIDCGNWTISGSWAVPDTAVSGIYFAKVLRTDTGGASHIMFVVRDDLSTSDLLFQTSDTTWQAYNNYGGNSLYSGGPGTNPNRAYKVSYNRPFNTRAVDGGQDWVFNAEYPMVRWLEANGYNVSYATGVDSARSGGRILNHKVFMSVGHDEYWSGDQRANVEAARNAGVNLAFFSGNEIFWKTRWENSIDASGTTFRTLVSYKETHANGVIDPADPPVWTGTWRDPRFSPPADGGRPENALAGTIFMVNDGATTAITVPAADGKMRFWRNTSIASLTTGSATLPGNTLGYEWDSDLDNGSRPAGLFRLSTTVVNNAPVLQDFGSTYGSGTITHYLTLYKHASGARVFGAGTVQWSWGLDSNHDRGNAAPDVRMQQATANLFADMGAQPATLQSGLVPASASTDSAPPTSTITSPASGATLQPGVAVTVSGTAADTGGGVVGGVEVSVDGGTSWHPANGRANWTYTWTPAVNGTATLRSRAVDDSGNLETPSAGIGVTVGSGSGQGVLVGDATIRANVDSNPAGTAEAFQYTATASGTATKLYLYVDGTNTATQIVVGIYGNSASDTPGTLLAQATIAGPTSGWNAVPLPSATIASGTRYWIAVLGPSGAGLIKFRDTAGGGGKAQVSAQTNLTTLPASWSSGTSYTDSPMSSYAVQEGPDTVPPTVTTTFPASGATGVGTGTAVTATFSEAMNATSLNTSTFLLSGPGGSVPATVTYNAQNLTATLVPSSGLASATTYTATVVGGTLGAKDLAGNALAGNFTWSFTTSATGDTTPPTITTRSPAGGATGVSATTNVTATFNEAMNATTISTATFVLRTSGGAQVPATVTYTPATLTATLSPNSPLASTSTYTATVSGGASGVKDLAGNALATNSTWSFTTADSVPPTITAISPADGATAVSGTANVTATFSEAMNAATISTATFVLRDPSNAVIAAAVSYNATSRVATLNPTPTLTAGLVYTATVVSGASGVKDVAGNALAADKIWTFTIFADTSAPSVTSTSPTAGATGISRTANVTATFSEAVNGATVTPSTIVLRDSTNAVVPATVALSANGRTATLNPSPTLAWNTTYTTTVVGGAAGVKDLSGNAMTADVVWSFTTLVDTTPPTITSTSPANGATNVSKTANVTATFSEAMDPATITTNFVLTGPAGAVPAAVTLNAASTVATLNPNPTLGALTTYTATVKGGSTGAKDQQGNPLAADRVWTFTTR